MPMTIQERWAADEELADELATEGTSFAQPVEGSKARHELDVDGEGDLSVAYGPGAKPHAPPEMR